VVRLVAGLLLVAGALLLVALLGQGVAGASELADLATVGRSDPPAAVVLVGGDQGEGHRSPDPGTDLIVPKGAQVRLEDPPRVQPTPERVAEPTGEGGGAGPGDGGRAAASSGTAEGSVAAHLVAAQAPLRPSTPPTSDGGPAPPVTALVPDRTEGVRQLGRFEPLDLPKATRDKPVAFFPANYSSAENRKQLAAVTPALEADNFKVYMTGVLPRGRATLNPQDPAAVHRYLSSALTGVPTTAIAADIEVYDAALARGMRIGGLQPTNEESLRPPSGAPPLPPRSEQEAQQRILANLPETNRIVADEIQRVRRENPDVRIIASAPLLRTGYGTGATVNALLAAKDPPIDSTVLWFTHRDGQPAGNDPYFTYEAGLVEKYADLTGKPAMLQVKGTRITDWMLANPGPAAVTLDAERQAKAEGVLAQLVDVLNERYRLHGESVVTRGVYAPDIAALVRNDQRRTQLEAEYLRIVGGPAQPGLPPAPPTPRLQRGSPEVPEDATGLATLGPDAPAQPNATSASPERTDPAALLDAERTTSVFDNSGPVGSGNDATLPAGGVLDASSTVIPQDPATLAETPDGDGGDGGFGDSLLAGSLGDLGTV